MKALVLYRPNAEFARMVEEYARDIESQKGLTLELISVDSIEGADMAKLYGIVQYPAILAIREDGQLMREWQGERLPLMDEVAGYCTR